MEGKKWWKFKKIEPQDYGRLAILGFILLYLKTNAEKSVNFGIFLNFVSGLVAIATIIFGGLWFANLFEKDGKQ